MADVLANVILAISGSIPLSIVFKATVLVAVTLAGARLARRARASVRHVFLASLFGVLLALPVAAICSPPVTVEIARPPVVGRTSGPAEDRQDGWADGSGQAGPKALLNDLTRRRSSGSTWTLSAVVWGSGATCFLLPLLTGSWHVRRIRRASLPWVEGQVMVRNCAAEAGIHRSVEVLLHEEVTAPMTTGFARPVLGMATRSDLSARVAAILDGRQQRGRAGVL